jgi:hypothetical protein
VLVLVLACAYGWQTVKRALRPLVLVLVLVL